MKVGGLGNVKRGKSIFTLLLNTQKNVVKKEKKKLSSL